MRSSSSTPESEEVYEPMTGVRLSDVSLGAENLKQRRRSKGEPANQKYDLLCEGRCNDPFLVTHVEQLSRASQRNKIGSAPCAVHGLKQGIRRLSYRMHVMRGEDERGRIWVSCIECGHTRQFGLSDTPRAHAL